MNLRIARKIIKAVGTPDAARYNDFQIGKALVRVKKMREAKDANVLWMRMMASIRAFHRRLDASSASSSGQSCVSGACRGCEDAAKGGPTT